MKLHQSIILVLWSLAIAVIGDDRDISQEAQGWFIYPTGPGSSFLEPGQPDFIEGKTYNITWTVHPKHPRVMLELRVYVYGIGNHARRSILIGE